MNLPVPWSGTPYAIIKHWTSGTCYMNFQPLKARSKDVFSLVDVADAVSLVVAECVEERGGKIGGTRMVGPKGDFRVDVQYNHR